MENETQNVKVTKDDLYNEIGKQTDEKLEKAVEKINTKIDEIKDAETSKKFEELESKIEKLSTPKAPAFKMNEDVNKEEKGLGLGRWLRLKAVAKLDNVSFESYAKSEYDRTKNKLTRKVLDYTDFASGGALVPEELYSDVVPYLENASVFRKAGANVWPMPFGNLTIPKETAGVTGYWMNSSTDTTASEPTYGDIQLQAKKFGVLVPVANDLLRMPNIKVEQNIISLVGKKIGAGETAAFLRGTGASNEPKGVYNWVASGAKANSGGATLALVNTDAAAAIERVEGQNIMMEKPAWVMSSRSKNGLMKLMGSDMYTFRDEILNGTWMGYPIYVTNAISNAVTSTYSEVYLIDMAKCFIGEMGGLEIEVIPNGTYGSGSNTVSGVSRDLSVIRAFSKVDFALAYDRSAAIIEQVSWA